MWCFTLTDHVSLVTRCLFYWNGVFHINPVLQNWTVGVVVMSTTVVNINNNSMVNVSSVFPSFLRKMIRPQ